MFASDWIFCLFSNIVPIHLMAQFYDNFFSQGWKYFYSFCLSMLDVIQERLLLEDDFSGIISSIKLKTPDKYATTSLANKIPSSSSSNSGNKV